MHTLIIAIIAIALTASALYGGINYIDFSSYEDKVFNTVIVNDLYSYEMALESHNTRYNYYPEASNLESELGKMNAIIPVADIGTYTYYNDEANNDVAICYSLEANKYEMENLEKIYNKGGFVRSSTCFDKTSEVVDDGMNYPQQISITKWIQF